MTVIKNFSPYKIVISAIQKLKTNEQKVILGRFGIDENRKTLSTIGRELNLSRERIRQIEKEALKKMASEIIQKNNFYIEQIIASFEKSGGISSHSKIAEKFLDKVYRENKNEFNALNLIFYLMPELIKIDKTKEMEESWTLSTISKEDIIKVINDWVDHLEKSKKPQSIDVLLKANPNHSKYQVSFLSELPYISKKIIKTEDELIGLTSWPEVNPKNVRDKIFYILSKENKPLHFEEIAKKINEQNFSNKKVVKATVHNELIADNRFVLIGRGIYALSEWGYNTGTVFDVIKEVLSKHDKMKVEEIVSEVLKQRAVKKNTILINLQTKKDFIKVGKDQYSVRKS